MRKSCFDDPDLFRSHAVCLACETRDGHAADCRFLKTGYEYLRIEPAVYIRCHDGGVYANFAGGYTISRKIIPMILTAAPPPEETNA